MLSSYPGSPEETGNGVPHEFQVCVSMT
jgi:hypothetical protein